MDGFIVKPRWCEAILYNNKVWEIRGSDLIRRGNVYLLESGTGRVVGVVEIVNSSPFTKRDFVNHKEKHLLPSEYTYEDVLRRYKKPYKWELKLKSVFANPYYYQKPRGCVIWVKNVESYILEDKK